MLMGLGILGFALAVGVSDSGDAKKEKDKEKVKHAIPTGWKALKLTNDQKKQVYAIQDEYQPKIVEAKRKVAALDVPTFAATPNRLVEAVERALKGDPTSGASV